MEKRHVYGLKLAKDNPIHYYFVGAADLGDAYTKLAGRINIPIEVAQKNYCFWFKNLSQDQLLRIHPKIKVTSIK